MTYIMGIAFIVIIILLQYLHIHNCTSFSKM
jgi:preprotein translocase subunit SecG